MWALTVSVWAVAAHGETGGWRRGVALIAMTWWRDAGCRSIVAHVGTVGWLPANAWVVAVVSNCWRPLRPEVAAVCRRNGSTREGDGGGVDQEVVVVRRECIRMRWHCQCVVIVVVLKLHR